MRDYEKTFDPSKHRSGKKPEKNSESTEVEKPNTEPTQSAWIERTEKVMGYKVQIFSSANLDEAIKTREMYKEVLEGIAVDMVFDAPYYKLRVGNFLEKKLADELKNELQLKGIQEAWVVRDQVMKTVREQVNEK